MKADATMCDKGFSAGAIAAAASDSRRIIQQHAMAAAAAGAVPVIGVDFAAEVVIATAMVNRILVRFGLTHDQISAADVAVKITVMQSVRQQGGVIVGRAVTSKGLAWLITHSGKSLVSRRVARFVPMIGTAVSVAIGYAVMRATGNAVLNECIRVRAEALAVMMQAGPAVH